jgi:hypothetical protein
MCNLKRRESHLSTGIVQPGLSLKVHYFSWMLCVKPQCKDISPARHAIRSMDVRLMLYVKPALSRLTYPIILDVGGIALLCAEG